MWSLSWPSELKYVLPCEWPLFVLTTDDPLCCLTSAQTGFEILSGTAETKLVLETFLFSPSLCLSIKPHCFIMYCIVLYRILSYRIVLYCIASYRIELFGMVWYGVVWYGMVWHGMVWHGMVWHGMVWYGMVWYGMVWYGMVWYSMVWYGVVFIKYSTRPHWMLADK